MRIVRWSIAAALAAVAAAAPPGEPHTESFAYVGGTGNEAQFLSLTCTGAVHVGVGVVCFLIEPGDAVVRFEVRDEGARALGLEACALAEFHDDDHANLLEFAFLGASPRVPVPAAASHVLVSPAAAPQAWELCGAGAAPAATTGTALAAFNGG